MFRYIIDRVIAVSYTHLDVYKRQGTPGLPALHQPGGGVPGKGAAGGAVRAPGEADPPDPGRTDLPGADLPHFVEAGGAGRRDEKGAEGRGYDTS